MNDTFHMAAGRLRLSCGKEDWRLKKLTGFCLYNLKAPNNDGRLSEALEKQHRVRQHRRITFQKPKATLCVPKDLVRLRAIPAQAP